MRRIGYFVILAIMILFALFSFADFDPSAGGVALTEEEVQAMSGSTIITALSTGSDVTTEQVIVDLNNDLLRPIRYRIDSSTFRMKATCFLLLGMCDDAEYFVSGITANTNYIIGITWDLSDTDGDSPEVWINGEQQTVTQVDGGSSTGNDSQSLKYFGNNSAIDTQFLGSIAYVGFWNSKIPDSALESITGSNCYDLPTQYAGPSLNPLHFWMFNTATDGIGFSGTVRDLFGYGTNGEIFVLQAFIVGKANNWLSYCGAYG